ncbi:hypothetical protein ZWY2020_027865 [Hordeum vulgare]|nr:hypothetical protein ZWY2020_027865 [Hordeum vulgare]
MRLADSQRRHPFRISLGSQISILRQMMELATHRVHRRPFIRAFRPPMGFDADGAKCLPEVRQARPPLPLAWLHGADREDGWAAVRISRMAPRALSSHFGGTRVESLTHGVPSSGGRSAEQFYNATMSSEEVGAA